MLTEKRDNDPGRKLYQAMKRNDSMRIEGLAGWGDCPEPKPAPVKQAPPKKVQGEPVVPTASKTIEETPTQSLERPRPASKALGSHVEGLANSVEQLHILPQGRESLNWADCPAEEQLNPSVRHNQAKKNDSKKSDSLGWIEDRKPTAPINRSLPPPTYEDEEVQLVPRRPNPRAIKSDKLQPPSASQRGRPSVKDSIDPGQFPSCTSKIEAPTERQVYRRSSGELPAEEAGLVKSAGNSPSIQQAPPKVDLATGSCRGLECAPLVSPINPLNSYVPKTSESGNGLDNLPPAMVRSPELSEVHLLPVKNNFIVEKSDQPVQSSGKGPAKKTVVKVTKPLTLEKSVQSPETSPNAKTQERPVVKPSSSLVETPELKPVLPLKDEKSSPMQQPKPVKQPEEPESQATSSPKEKRLISRPKQKPAKPIAKKKTVEAANATVLEPTKSNSIKATNVQHPAATQPIETIIPKPIEAISEEPKVAETIEVKQSSPVKSKKTSSKKSPVDPEPVAPIPEVAVPLSRRESFKNAIHDVAGKSQSPPAIQSAVPWNSSSSELFIPQQPSLSVLRPHPLNSTQSWVTCPYCYHCYVHPPVVPQNPSPPNSANAYALSLQSLDSMPPPRSFH